MKHNQTLLKLAAIAFLFCIAAFVQSCKKSTDPISGEVSQTVSNESSQDSQSDEMDDISTNQANKVDPKTSRTQTGDDGRVACANITVDTLSNRIIGTITIDFDKTPAGEANPDGCTDARGNVRKGKLVIHWEGGRWFSPGAVITITAVNYSINGVVFNGTRTLTNVTDLDHPLIPTWNIVASLTITWPDAKTATREVHKTRAWNILLGTVTVSQTAGADAAASGTTRRGVTYSVQITEPLVFKLTCIGESKVYIPVSGTKVITFNDKTVTVDFGSGDCDNTFTVTYNGKTETFTATNDSTN